MSTQVLCVFVSICQCCADSDPVIEIAAEVSRNIVLVIVPKLADIVEVKVVDAVLVAA